MTPEQAAEATTDAIVATPRHFTMAPATWERGAELGLEGFGFYLYGRGAVLGDVPAGVVAAAYAFFDPQLVGEGWSAGRAVVAPEVAAAAWAGAAHAWAEGAIAEDVDCERIAALCARVVGQASTAGAPLFAGWRCLPEPDDRRALVVHRLNALRELRGALHAMAVRAVGLTPIEAIMVKDGWMASLYGWPEPWPDPTPEVQQRWAHAEHLTNVMVAPVLGVLDHDERTELAELLGDLHARLAPG